MLDIKFPIYPIRNHKRIINKGKGPVILISVTNLAYVIDDTSLEGTFGQRRMKVEASLKKSTDFYFYRLKKALRGWAELTKDLKKNKVRMYVDSTGYIFKYQPSTFYPLRYHKILKRINVTGKGWSIEVSGVPWPLKLNYIPTVDMQYAGIIKLPTGYTVYELSSEKKPDTRRKI